MFSLSKKTDYGLMALGFLAQVDERPVNAREIAERYCIPVELLAKVMQTLAREGLVLSFSGPKGGYQLARGPEEITVSDVIRAIEGPIALSSCQSGPATDCEQFYRCPIVRPMERIRDRVIALLDGMTLLDMMGMTVGEVR